MQDLQFLVHERQHGVPGLDLRDRVLERHGPVPREARERHRKVLHQRRVHHVAEVDDADDLVCVRLGAQQVVGVPVAVHDLGAQRGQARQHLALQARHEVRAQRLRVVGHPGLHTGIQQQRALDVPGDEMPAVRMEKSPQPAREPGLESSSIPEHPGFERLALRQRGAGQPAQHAHHVAPAVRGGDPLAVAAAFRGDDARHGQLRCRVLEMAQRRDLEIHGALALAHGGHLEHIARAVRRRHAMVLVALAVQRRELTLEAPVIAGDVPQLPERKPGRIEVEVDGVQKTALIT